MSEITAKAEHLEMMISIFRSESRKDRPDACAERYPWSE
jgi:hypothetical protein